MTINLGEGEPALTRLLVIVFGLVIIVIFATRGSADRENSRLTIATLLIAVVTAIGALISFNTLTELRDEQRPWVKIQQIEAAVRKSDPSLGGLMFLGENTPAYLPLHIELKNVGRSPAFDVRVGIQTFFGYAQRIDKLSQEQGERCAALDKSLPSIPILVENTWYVPVLFPSDEAAVDSLALGVTPAQIKEFAKGEPGKEEFQLWFYGCVRYSYPDSSARRQTSFAYRVGQMVDAPIPGGKALQLTFRPWKDVPADRILIDARPMAAGVTN